jgi:hypothetical protein
MDASWGGVYDDLASARLEGHRLSAKYGTAINIMRPSGRPGWGKFYVEKGTYTFATDSAAERVGGAFVERVSAVKGNPMRRRKKNPDSEERGDDMCDMCMSSGVHVDRTTYCGQTIGRECGCDDAYADATCDDDDCEDCKPHRKSKNPDDDEDEVIEEEEDFDLRGEMSEGGVISDGRGGLYNVALSGKHLDDFNDFDKALKFLVQTMEDEKYYPNIFYVNDHGNVELLGVKPKVVKGKVIKVKYEYLRGWV